MSFAEYKNLAAIQEDKHRDIFLGELILCYNNIDVYAKKRGIKTEEEIVNVFSHGVLHLLGMRHGKKMFNIQKKVVKKTTTKKATVASGKGKEKAKPVVKKVRSISLTPFSPLSAPRQIILALL